MKLNKLTYEEHVQIGAQLKQARIDLSALALRLAASEGKNSSVTRAVNRAVDSAGSLRARLDSVLCASLPLTDESWRGVYYGNRKD